MIELSIIAYLTMAGLSTIVLFLCFYVSTIYDYGILVGGTVGIIPSALLAIIMSVFWPVTLLFIISKY